jgi:hypothetical protein
LKASCHGKKISSPGSGNGSASMHCPNRVPEFSKIMEGSPLFF